MSKHFGNAVNFSLVIFWDGGKVYVPFSGIHIYECVGGRGSYRNEVVYCQPLQAQRGDAIMTPSWKNLSNSSLSDFFHTPLSEKIWMEVETFKNLKKYMGGVPEDWARSRCQKNKIIPKHQFSKKWEIYLLDDCCLNLTISGQWRTFFFGGGIRTHTSFWPYGGKLQTCITQRLYTLEN